VIKKVSDHNKPFVKSNLLRYKSHNTISIPKQFVRNNVQQEECLTYVLQFWRDQALRLLRLKGHVRARGLTLWQHSWQEASEFLCTKTPLFGGSGTIKNIAKNPRKCFLLRATNVAFSKLLLTPQKTKPRSPRIFQTSLRAVLINPLIRINSGPKILRSCFLHWHWQRPIGCLKS